MKCKSCNTVITEKNCKHTLGRSGKKYKRTECNYCCNQKLKEKTKIKYSNEWFTRKFCKLKRNAKLREKRFDITKDQYIQLYKENDKCFFCEEVEIKKTIGRVNNSKGYIINNIVICCMKCNVLKRNILIDDKSRLLKILSKL